MDLIGELPKQGPEHGSGLLQTPDLIFALLDVCAIARTLAGQSTPGFAERRGVIRFAFALEFFLGRLEACDACRDFLARAREPVFLFGHCPSCFVLNLVPRALAVAIGAPIGKPRCRNVMMARQTKAVDKD